MMSKRDSSYDISHVVALNPVGDGGTGPGAGGDDAGALHRGPLGAPGGPPGVLWSCAQLGHFPAKLSLAQ